MKIFNWILTLSLLIGVAACTKQDSVTPVPNVSLSTDKDTLWGELNKEINIVATVNNKIAVKHMWKIDEEVISESAEFTYTPKNAGTFEIVYTGSNSTGVFSRKLVLIVEPVARPITDDSSPYISKVFEYFPAPGQFINTGLGNPEAAQKLVGSKTALLSLGGYGGYVVFGFDHSILNGAGSDIAVYGNPLDPRYPWSEPGIVMVSVDANGNGLADDAWYELAGSEYNSPKTIKNYEITYYNPKEAGKDVHWKDNQGKTDVVLANIYHKQEYYPLFVDNQDSITFKGTVLESTFKHEGLFTNTPFSWGYADSWSSGDNYGENLYNSFDISNAVNSKGEKVYLKSIDFVKIYTGQNSKGNTMLGEISTEVKGAADIRLLK